MRTDTTPSHGLLAAGLIGVLTLFALGAGALLMFTHRVLVDFDATLPAINKMIGPGWVTALWAVGVVAVGVALFRDEPSRGVFVAILITVVLLLVFLFLMLAAIAPFGRITTSLT